jgi:hypothetical protein
MFKSLLIVLFLFPPLLMEAAHAELKVNPVRSGGFVTINLAEPIISVITTEPGWYKKATLDKKGLDVWPSPGAKDSLLSIYTQSGIYLYMFAESNKRHTESLGVKTPDILHSSLFAKNAHGVMAVVEHQKQMVIYSNPVKKITQTTPVVRVPKKVKAIRAEPREIEIAAKSNSKPANQKIESLEVIKKFSVQEIPPFKPAVKEGSNWYPAKRKQMSDVLHGIINKEE